MSYSKEEEAELHFASAASKYIDQKIRFYMKSKVSEAIVFNKRITALEKQVARLGDLADQKEVTVDSSAREAIQRYFSADIPKKNKPHPDADALCSEISKARKEEADALVKAVKEISGLESFSDQLNRMERKIDALTEALLLNKETYGTPPPVHHSV